MMHCADVALLVQYIVLTNTTNSNKELDVCKEAQNCGIANHLDNVVCNLRRISRESSYYFEARNSHMSMQEQFLASVVDKFQLDSVNFIMESSNSGMSMKSATAIFKYLSKTSVIASMYQFDNSSVQVPFRSKPEKRQEGLSVNNNHNIGLFLYFSSLDTLGLFLQQAFVSDQFWDLNKKWFLQWNWKSIDWQSFLNQSQVFLPLSLEFYVTQKNGDIVEFHEVYQKDRNSALVSNQIGQWNNSTSDLIKVASNIWERRKNLTGVMIRTASLDDIPFIAMEPDGSNGYKLSGYLADVWRELQKILGFQYSVVRSVDEKWGALKDDGKTFNGMVGMIQRDEIDVAISSFWSNRERFKAADYSITLITSLTRLYIKTPTPNAGWWTYLNPLSIPMWIFNLVMLIVGSLSLTFTHRYSVVDEYVEEPTILTSIRSFCQQGASQGPEGTSSRVVFFTLFLVSFVLISAYGGFLTSFLAVSKVNFPFQNLHDLYHRKDFKVGAIQDSIFESMFKNAGIKLWGDIYKDKFDTVPTLAAGLNKVKTDPTFAFLYQEESMDVIQNPTEACAFVKTQQTVAEGKMVLLFEKKFPYKPLFNYYLTQMRERGMLRSLWNHWKPTLKVDCFAITETSVIDMDTVKSIFTLLACSIVISTIILALEVLGCCRCKMPMSRKVVSPVEASANNNSGEKRRQSIVSFETELTLKEPKQ